MINDQKGCIFIRSLGKILLPYGTAVLSCILLMVWIFDLCRADLAVPFVYEWDSLVTAMTIKGMLDNGWYLNNPYLGMPFGMNLYDFPVTDHVQFVVIKLMSLFISDYGKLLNLYFLLSYPLTVITALFTFRYFGVSYFSAGAGAILFAFLPYHILRGELHLYFATYYLVPLTLLTVLWVSEKNLFFTAHNGKTRLSVTKEGWWALLICALSSAHYYYAFFACFFFIITGAYTSFRKQSLAALLSALILTGVLLVGVAVNLSPMLTYQYQHGKHKVVSDRNIGDAEVYGLKLAQLVLPVSEHRITALRDLRAYYDSHTPLNSDTENKMAALGLVGAAGLISSLAYVLFRRTASASPLFHNLSVLNVSALLLATIGGIGSLVAFLISPVIRGYNRLSLYIGFFSLFCVAILLDRLLLRYSGSRGKKAMIAATVIISTICGVYDQNPPFHPARYQTEYYIHRDFVKQVENVLPPQSMVFQLPYVPFPASPPVHGMQDYDHLRPYLHSQTVRWSYGAMRDRIGDTWQRDVASQPVHTMLEQLAQAGFAGIYLNRTGYGDHGLALEQALSARLGPPTVISNDGNLALYALAGKITATSPNTTGILPVWSDGFYASERNGQNTWHWSSSQSKLTLVNTTNETRTVTLTFSVATGYPEQAILNMTGIVQDQITINNQPTQITKTITLPQGTHTIQFSTNAQRVNAPGDGRTLIFRVNDFSFK